MREYVFFKCNGGIFRCLSKWIWYLNVVYFFEYFKIECIDGINDLLFICSMENGDGIICLCDDNF